MRVLNLVEEFVALPQSEQSWERYERHYPALFEHYFRYWCPRERGRPTFDTNGIRERARRVLRTLDVIEPRLKERLSIRELTVVLFVGGDTSNGHAFLDGDRCVVWIPVETYATDHRAHIFLTHEIIHGLHYSRAREFFFQDELSKNQLGRQLITEGVATFLTAQILGVSEQEALWADYLTPEQFGSWLVECQMREPELRAFFREHFFESMVEPALFQANNPADVVNYRAGYFVGLAVVRNLLDREKLSLQDLLELPRQQFESFALRELGPSK
jgi:hypothetical protein